MIPSQEAIEEEAVEIGKGGMLRRNANYVDNGQESP